MAQILAIQHVDRTPHIEQLALDSVGQRALAGARQAGEQHGGRLLAEACRALFGSHVSQRAVMAAGTLDDRIGDDHARTDGTVGEPVDDDEGTGGAVLRITVQRDGRIQANPDLADLVELEAARRALLQCIHVHRVGDAGDGARHVAGGALDVVFLARQHRLFAHPHQHGVEAVGDARQVVGMHQHVATGYVDLVFQRQSDRLARRGLLQLAVVGDDGLDPAGLARRQYRDFIALAHNAAGQGTGEATEIQVRPVDVLHREAQVVEVAVAGNLDAFKDFHQRLAFVPVRPLALVDDVVALECGHGHEMQRSRLETDTLGKG